MDRNITKFFKKFRTNMKQKVIMYKNLEYFRDKQKRKRSKIFATSNEQMRDNILRQKCIRATAQMEKLT